MPRLLPLLLLCSLLTTCAVEDFVVPEPLPATPSDAFFELKPTTLLLDDDTNLDLIAYDTSGVIAYRLGSPQLDSIEVGSVLLSRPTDRAIGGFLERVVSKKIEGDRLVLTTEPANLPEAFERYRWRLDGSVSALRSGRDNGNGIHMIDGLNICYNDGFEQETQTVSVVKTFDIPNSNWKFELSAQLEYKLRIKSEFDYNLFGGAEVTHMVLGVDSFELNKLEIAMAFTLAGDTTLTQTFFTPEEDPEFYNLLEFALTPLPIDPAALVWVQPVVRVDFSTKREFNAKIGNRFTLLSTGPFKALALKTAAGAPITYSRDQGTELRVNGEVFVEGSFAHTTNVAIGFGLAPYTRSLLSAGVRVGAGPKFSVAGALSAGIVDADLVWNGSGNAKVEANVSAGAFVDFDFFGFAGDDLDQNLEILSRDFEFFSIGVDNTCDFYFDDVFTEIICPGNSQPARLRFRVNDANNPHIDLSGTYKVYVDGILQPGTYSPGTDTVNISLAGTQSLGSKEIRFVRSGNQSVLFCEHRASATLVNCVTDDPCLGSYDVIDPTTQTAYCIKSFQSGTGGSPSNISGNSDRWFANNLYSLLSDGSNPTCYEDARGSCNVYGGLYSFGELLGVSNSTAELPGDSTRGLCPPGWHVPSVAEWTRLLQVEGATVPATGLQLPGWASQYRAPSTWNSGTVPTNPNGFNVLAGGGYTDSSNPSFDDRGRNAYFWTSSVPMRPAVDGSGEEPVPGSGFLVIFIGNSGDVHITQNARTFKASCRCIED